MKTFFFIFVIFSLFCIQPCFADMQTGLSRSQQIYVPAYSHIYSGVRERPFSLTVTLSIRNIDTKHSMSILKADYYDTNGICVKQFLDKPIELKPLASIRYVVPEDDKSGGSGANFIVDWKSSNLINPPIVESIMIGTQSQQGISFTSRGQIILPPK